MKKKIVEQVYVSMCGDERYVHFTRNRQSRKKKSGKYFNVKPDSVAFRYLSLIANTYGFRIWVQLQVYPTMHIERLPKI